MLIGNRVRIVYVSQTRGMLGNIQLQDLLERARSFNARHGVTGLLIHRSNEFFQIIEGDREVVDPLFDRIFCDERHLNVHLLLREEDVAPHFADWSMGFVSLDQDMIPGIIDVLGGEYLHTLRGDAARVQALIEGFTEERWRRWIG